MISGGGAEADLAGAGRELEQPLAGLRARARRSSSGTGALASRHAAAWRPQPAAAASQQLEAAAPLGVEVARSLGAGLTGTDS